MSDVIVTGIPRAGTTLAAAFIDSLPDTVCLNEPSWHNARVANDAKGFAEFIVSDIAALRKRLLAGAAVPDRRGKDGSAITNYYATGMDGAMQEKFAIVPLVRAGLPKDFTLAVKHNGPYLAVLPELIAREQFSIIAVIRDPLPVIRSWRRLQLPISRGDMPNAKPYWPELRQLIDRPMDLLEKQVRLYELMLSRILHYQSNLTLIRYEQMVENPLLVAEALGKEAATLPALVQPQAVTASEEDAAINAMLKRYARLACELWPR